MPESCQGEQLGDGIIPCRPGHTGKARQETLNGLARVCQPAQERQQVIFQSGAGQERLTIRCADSEVRRVIELAGLRAPPLAAMTLLALLPAPHP